MLLQVVKQTFTLTNQLHQAAVSREVFFVFLQVSADLADPLRQLGNLTFGRTRIFSFAAKFCENLCCFFFS